MTIEPASITRVRRAPRAPLQKRDHGRARRDWQGWCRACGQQRVSKTAPGE